MGSVCITLFNHAHSITIFPQVNFRPICKTANFTFSIIQYLNTSSGLSIIREEIYQMHPFGTLELKNVKKAYKSRLL